MNRLLGSGRADAGRFAVAAIAVLVVAGLVVALVESAWLARGSSGAAPAAETEVPVHVAAVRRTTVRRYVSAYGTVTPAPAANGRAAAASKLASPEHGVVVEVRCREGERVEQGSVLFQLDERACRRRRTARGPRRASPPRLPPSVRARSSRSSKASSTGRG